MILLADSGSTKTDWLLLDGGQQSTRFASVGFNPFYQSQAVIAEGLRTEVVPKISGSVQEIHFYGAGCADAATSRPARDALADAFPTAGKIEVNSDLLAAARGLCGHEPGIACILGTGSNNCLYDGEKIVGNVGSLGFWLGDEGSGGYLGKRLVVNYLHGELPADLHEAFQTTFPEVARLSVLDRAYKQPFPNRYFATFAPFLSQHLGHSFVREIVQDAFRFFLEKYVVRHPGSAALPVHFTGSVAYYFEVILKETLIEKGLQPGLVLKSPMAGLVQYHGGVVDLGSFGQ